MKNCPSCQASVSDEAKFCVKCGFNIKKHEEENTVAFCPECGTKFSGGVFCPECGYNVSKDLERSDLDVSSLDTFDFVEMQKEVGKQLVDESKARVKADSDISNGVLHKYYGNETEIYVPDDIIEIGEKAFELNKEITRVVLPEGLRKIGDSAFMGCTRLEKINLPSSLTIIGQMAFCCCDSLKSVRVPHGVTRLPLGAFSACSQLERVILPTSLEAIESSAFSGCQSLTEINLPNKITTIEGSLFNGCKSLKKLYLHNGLLRICNSAFCGCESLTTISIPSSVTSVESNAFAKCTSLESVSIYASLSRIEYNLFENCKALKSIVLPASVSSIGNFAFHGCESLERIDIPKNVKDLGLSVSAFWDCKSLKSVNVDSGNEYSCSIDGCLYDKLGDGTLCLVYYPQGRQDTEFNIPPKTKFIMSGAFMECDYISSIRIHNDVETIFKYSFKNCKNLRTLYIPRGKQFNDLPSDLQIIEY